MFLQIDSCFTDKKKSTTRRSVEENNPLPESVAEDIHEMDAAAWMLDTGYIYSVCILIYSDFYRNNLGGSGTSSIQHHFVIQ
ncbi:MAG: hypothetical protein DRH17_03455 [Deltaproteobacteria bacterium]|nr:MAG: hypothetical protein DRH17_03455 [Deltaproteobacteria bacterium]